jgi:hypothetical protein
MRYQPLYEDPEYYPKEWEEAFPEPTEEEIEEMLRDMEREYDPYGTINS